MTSLRREPWRLGAEPFDVLVIGGGVAGACAAWDAALRGFSVALVERGDFCGGTSAHSLKILHGGIRYVQHLDLVRLRESCRERSAFVRIAPHLAGPLPFAVPTYGHGVRGKEALAGAFALTALLTPGRNRGIADPERRFPAGRMLSRRECLNAFPDLDPRGLTGAGVFYDGHVHNPPRLVLGIVRAAASAGAQASNYVEVEELLRTGDRVTGVRARDGLSGDTFDIRAAVTINATGPFAEALLVRAGLLPRATLPLSRDMAFVVRRRYASDMAVAVQTRFHDPDAVLSRGARHLFLVPWRSYTHIGVNSRVFRGDPDALEVPEAEIDAFLAEINGACPSFRLTPDDILAVNAGLLPFGDNTADASDLSFGKRSWVNDHRATAGITGLISATSVRLTTGRLVAERAVDLAAEQLARRTSPSSTGRTPIHGGGFGHFAALAAGVTAQLPPEVPPAVGAHLARHHGGATGELIGLLRERPELRHRLGGTPVTGAEVVHAVRREMAVKLADTVLRRTELGTGEYPGDAAVRECAVLMARELGWDAVRIEAEVTELRDAVGRPAAGFRLASSNAPALVV